MPRTVAQQATELRQSREVREFNGSVGLDQRKLVKSLPDVAPLAAVQQNPVARGDVQVIEPAVADPGFASFHGTVGDGSGSEGQTALRQRTCFAAGRRGRTLNRPEVHDRLVVAARMRGVELRLRQAGESPFSGRGVDRFGEVEEPREHPVDITVDDGARSVVSRRADGRRGIVAHAAQRTHVVQRAGKHPSETLYDLTGGGPEVAGAAVIAQPLPEFQHLVLGRGGERRNVGKTLRETEVVLHPLRHAGLLEDHFREPDPVGIARTAPRQVTTLAGVPVEQYFGNAVHNGRQKYDFGIKFEAFRPN